jgi:hypothetical protein
LPRCVDTSSRHPSLTRGDAARKRRAQAPPIVARDASEGGSISAARKHSSGDNPFAAVRSDVASFGARAFGQCEGGRGDFMAKKSARNSSARKATARKAAAGTKKKTGGRRGTANAAFMRPVTPDATVAEVVGDKPIPRTEVTKRLWAYIKKNGLQDKKNKRMINADAPLKAVFGGKSAVNMFEMTKLVNKHLK